MQKILILAVMFVLAACSIFGTKTDDTSVYKAEKNPNCAEFKAVKVFQTLDDGALALVCEKGESRACLGMTVFVQKKWNIQLWDERIVTPPKDKCFTYDGTYKYETKRHDIKTVPVLGIEYTYSAKSEDEAKTRMLDRNVDLYKNCYINFEKEPDKTLKAEGDKLCACFEKLSNDISEQVDQGDEMLVLAVSDYAKMEDC